MGLLQTSEHIQEITQPLRDCMVQADHHPNIQNDDKEKRENGDPRL